MKKIGVFFIITIILICVFGIFIIATNKESRSIKENKLAGEKVIDGLYLYEIENDENISNIKVFNDNIYYLVNIGNSKELYKKNIYTNKTEKIGAVEGDYCYLDKCFLYCLKNDTTIIYNLNLERLYKSNEEHVKIVPYKDSFLKIIDHEIFFNEKEYRRIKDDYKNFDIIDYYVSDSNTYIYFISSNDSYIYNVLEDTYEPFEYNHIYLYSNGIYYNDLEEIIINDLKHNTVKNYKNNIKIDDLQFSCLKDNLLYYYEDGYLKVYNFETNKIQFIDYKMKNGLDNVMLNDKYVFMIYNDNINKIYIVNFDEIDLNEMTLDEFSELQNNRLDEKVKKIENQYNVNLEIKDVEKLYDNSFILTTENNYNILDSELDSLDKMLNKFGKEFFTLFKYNEYKGIKIIFTKKIKTLEERAIPDIEGISIIDDKFYNIILDTDGTALESTICHEIMHTMEEIASEKKHIMFENWYDYNPKENFEYGVDNYKNNNEVYTIEDTNNVYFIDSYAQVNQSEDIARIFENIAAFNKDSIVKKYPYLLKKAQYLKEEVLKEFPILENSTIFDSLN